MAKLTIDELRRIRDEAKRTRNLREGEGKARITVHMGTCGIASGAREVMDSLLRAIDDHGIKDVLVTTSGCAGLCSHEPMATVEYRDTAPVKYAKLTPEGIVRVLLEHADAGSIVREFALAIGSEKMS
ncbi:MAG: (2Fe-2S) ferredoxin domain-containing protein [Candidatus Eisenbacteria bacterium]|jgi:NADP-reducing hydrogenase subunit HndB|nr:(2Fe-2S) ferredoxin domain-containing protein [Candidatus Eisenbacteria bacterium]